MANTKLSDIGNKVDLSGASPRVSALADGTAKAGDAVGITQADGKVVQTDVGVSELFIGFLAPRYDTQTNTAPTAGVPVEIIVPKSGNVYGIHIEDPAGTEGASTPYTFSDTAGTMEAAATAILGLANLAEDVVTGDLYGKIRWN